MAQINMDKIKADIKSEAKELKTSEQPKASKQHAKLTNDMSEKQKDNSEINADNKAEERKDIVIVRYVGSGVWKDSVGKLWAGENKTENILNERKYSTDEYEAREDIKFMVKYGAMKVTFV